MKIERRIFPLVLSILSLAVFSYAWVYYPIAERHTGDFLNRLRGGWSFDHTWVYWDGSGIDVYGPLFTLLDYCIYQFQLERLTVLRVLFVLYLLLNIVTSFLLLKIFQFWQGAFLKKTIGIFLIVNFFPLIQALRQDVIENLQFFGLVLFIYFFAGRERRSSFRAALSLGLAICAKTFPVILVPYLAFRRQYAVVIGALTFFLAVTTGVASLKGITTLEGLRQMFLFSHALDALNFHQNQAISGFAYRLFAHFHYDNLISLTHPLLDQRRFVFFQATRYSLVLLIVMVTLWRVIPSLKRTWCAESKELIYFEISILLSLFLLVIPHTQIHYFLLTLPAYLLLFNLYFYSELERGKSKKGWLVLSYVLVGFKLPLRILDAIFPSPVACHYIQLTNLWNFPFYGNFLLLSLLGSSYRQRCKEVWSKDHEDY